MMNNIKFTNIRQGVRPSLTNTHSTGAQNNCQFSTSVNIDLIQAILGTN